MAQVTGLTAARMLDIEANAIVDGLVDVNGNLILSKHDGTSINAGSVIGPPGSDGADAAPGSVTAVGNTTPIRTSDGRIKAAAPTEDDDVVTRLHAMGLIAPMATSAALDDLRSDLSGMSLLGSSSDLNTLITPGVYTQASTANAAAGLNYPIAQAGLLEVFSSVGHHWQRYTPYGSYATRFYQRTYYGFAGTWSPWTSIYGGPDVGWTNLTPGSGFASSPTSVQKTASACLINGVVHFRGVLTGTFTVNTTHTVATIPTSLRPTQNASNFKVIGSTGGFLAWANATDTGVLSVHFKSPFATGSATIELSGMSYPLD